MGRLPRSRLGPQASSSACASRGLTGGSRVRCTVGPDRSGDRTNELGQDSRRRRRLRCLRHRTGEPERLGHGHSGPLSGYYTVWVVCGATAVLCAVLLRFVPKHALADAEMVGGRRNDKLTFTALADVAVVWWKRNCSLPRCGTQSQARQAANLNEHH